MEKTDRMMFQTAYITNVSKFLPNQAVSNDEMEEYLGKIKGLKSRSKAIVLRNNGIKSRYYAIDKNGNHTHTNCQMAVKAIQGLYNNDFKAEEIELLTCGTASPDVLMPAFATMVHGELGIGAIDAMTASGSCNSSMWAFNYAWMSVVIGKYKNAVCSGSEKISSWMMSKNFEEESAKLEALGENPYIAFDKEFLRWMLSDGAAAVLIQNEPNKNSISLRIDSIDIKSYANLIPACMFSGGVKTADNNLTPWRNFEPKEWIEQSIFSLQQDPRLLEEYITRLGGIFIRELVDKKVINLDETHYFLPHLSSLFFKKHIKQSLKDINLDIPDEKWFLNLDKVGNVGAASGFLMLEELFHSGKLKKGEKILMMIPESARFSYTYVQLTVV